MTKPILVFGYGNPSRGDDAVGPLLLEYLEQRTDLGRVELQTDFQLQVEHILDLQDRKLAIFVDASVAEDRAFTFKRINPRHDNSYTSHAMSPAALLHVFESVTGQTPPPSFLLSIKADSFDLGDGLSSGTAENLHLACEFICDVLNRYPDSMREQIHLPDEAIPAEYDK
ncbi:hydrogenase maturation protease [Methylomonas sp. MgM2]